MDSAMHSELVAQQVELLDALFRLQADATSGTDRGLAAYRSNANGIARSALAAAYPVVQQLIGAESFDQLAPVLWRQHPPSRGDLAQWGGALADFLEAQASKLGDAQYMPDVARLEWALHRMAAAEDVLFAAETFGMLAEQQPEQLRFVLAAGVQCMESAYPIASIWLAHTQAVAEGVTDSEYMKHAQQGLRDGVGEQVLLWRNGFKPSVRVMQPQEWSFLQAVLSGQVLSDALDAAHADFDFALWLQQSVADRLVCAVRVQQ